MKVLGDDKKLWEDEVYKFARKHQLEVHVGQITFSLTIILSFVSGLLRALVLVFYTCCFMFYFPLGSALQCKENLLVKIFHAFSVKAFHYLSA